MNRTDELKAYQRFRAAGMTKAGACGFIGNLEAESDGFYPTRVEYLCLKRLNENGIKDAHNNNYTDSTYTGAINSGRITRAKFLNPLPGKQYGYGLAQWTTPTRKAGLYDLAKVRQVSIGDLDMQIDYLLEELNNKFPSVLKVLKIAGTVKEASDTVLIKFEAPANASGLKASRAKRGQDFYNNYAKEDNMTQSQAIQQLIATAKKYNKYSEGAGNSNRFSTALGHPPQAWCDDFVDAVFNETFGPADANKLLCGGCGEPYTPTSAQYFKNAGMWTTTNPTAGDQIFFKNSQRINHTGIVTSVSGNTITTIEGNTSPANGVDPNGGGVYIKSYSKSNSRIAGYGRPRWNLIAGAGNPTPVKPVRVENPVIADGQIHANNFVNAGLTVDGVNGPLTRKAAVKVLQTALNMGYNAGLVVDGVDGPKTDAALKRVCVQKGNTGHLITAVEILLMLKGINPNGVENPGFFGTGCEAAVKWYQKENGLAVDGQAGYNTIRSLIS